jgi:hypothetical protein
VNRYPTMRSMVWPAAIISLAVFSLARRDWYTAALAALLIVLEVIW